MKKRGRNEGGPRAGQATPGARMRGVHPWVLVLTVASTFADTQGDVPKALQEDGCPGELPHSHSGGAPWQAGREDGGRGVDSGNHVPPLEGEGLPEHVGATVDLPEQLVVGQVVVDEDAVEAQRLQQRPHLLLQAAAAVDDGPEGLGDAQVLA